MLRVCGTFVQGMRRRGAYDRFTMFWSLRVPRSPWRTRLALGLAGAMLSACAQGGGASGRAAEVAVIAIERDCSGCPQSSRFELQRDGSARLVLIGKARFRTGDESRGARIEAAAFDALARRFEAAGFFGLDEVYEDPSLADGSWVQLFVARRGRPDKSVLVRNEAGPAVLAQLIAALEAEQRRLGLMPAPR